MHLGPARHENRCQRQRQRRRGDKGQFEPQLNQRSQRNTGKAQPDRTGQPCLIGEHGGYPFHLQMRPGAI